MIFYNDLYVAALGGLPTEFAGLFLLRYKNLCIIYIYGKYQSILTEKMIMQAIYSKSIVEIKTWNDMNDICTDSTTTGERIIIIFMHKYEGMYIVWLNIWFV